MFGLVIDIDGVLVKERHVIKGAAASLRRLLNSSDNFSVPLMFVTNGGNCTEEGRADRLRDMLGIADITSSRFIVSHSPLKEIRSLKESNVLLVGAEESIMHQIADHYQWKSYQTAQAFSKEHPYLFPHNEISISPEKLTTPIHQSVPFDNVVILSTPVQWEDTLQLLVDVLHPSDNKQSVGLYAANPDLVYSTEYCTPRLTTGAFVSCLKTLYQEFTGVPLEVTWAGKPFPLTYKYAEQKILQGSPNISTIYAVGDNPLSDIKGANEAGEKWHSILVQSGVHQSSENHAQFPARFVCKDISEAIDYILNKENQ